MNELSRLSFLKTLLASLFAVPLALLAKKPADDVGKYAASREEINSWRIAPCGPMTAYDAVPPSIQAFTNLSDQPTNLYSRGLVTVIPPKSSVKWTGEAWETVV